MTGYVLKMFPRFSETFILSEILELERRGRRIHVVSLTRPDDGRFHADVSRVRAAVGYLPDHLRCAPLRFAAAHLRVATRAPGAYLHTLMQTLRHRGETWRAFVCAPLVAEALVAAGCRRIHAHFANLPAITAMFASTLCGLPYSFTAHAKDIFLHDRSEALLRDLMRGASRVITVSDFNHDYLRRVAGPVDVNGRLIRIYNGIDLEQVRPAAELGSAGEPPLILAVGRLVEKKGFADLIDACAILRLRRVPFRCRIVGKGPLADELAACVRRHDLGSRVELVGPEPRESVMRSLERAALLAVPCVIGRDGNRDGLPTVILEAMAAGRPVVATAVTGIPEAVLDGTTGRVVEPGDTTAFVEALRELLLDDVRRARMGRSARRHAERLFDLRRNVASLDSCISGDAPPARPDLPAAPMARRLDARVREQRG